MNHYGLPAVSVRSLLLPRLLRDEPGFRQRDIMCSSRDLTLLGHQCGPPSPIQVTTVRPLLLL